MHMNEARLESEKMPSASRAWCISGTSLLLCAFLEPQIDLAIRRFRAAG